MELSILEQRMRWSLAGLFVEQGILASHKSEVYGCVFGRDTAVTVLKLLKVCELRPESAFLEVSERSLSTLGALQGKEVNLESGEEPGKIIHEYRTEGLERLISGPKPWYVYPGGVLKNYDSVDATPLTLIAIHRYWTVTKDKSFLSSHLPTVEAGLRWITDWADTDQDGLIEYRLHDERKHGGLRIQSWTDSDESFMRSDGTLPPYPIAPVEAQAYAWLALRLWSDFYETASVSFASALRERAEMMKRAFNEKFIFSDDAGLFAGQGVDGEKQLITTVTANPMLALWASYRSREGIEAIVDHKYIPDFVARIFLDDMYDPDAGVRTMSSMSPTYNPTATSYHNGSFWPMLNGMIYEGLLNFGYINEAVALREASLRAIMHFDTPIELYQKSSEGYFEYCSQSGQRSCKEQAWSAASILEMLVASQPKLEV